MKSWNDNNLSHNDNYRLLPEWRLDLESHPLWWVRFTPDGMVVWEVVIANCQRCAMIMADSWKCAFDETIDTDESRLCGRWIPEWFFQRRDI